MDKLEKLFKEQREAFDEEPEEGHFQRFEQKLDLYHSRKKATLRSWPFLKIASLVIIVLLSANLFVHLLPWKAEKKTEKFANNEMNETAFFYNTRISSGLSQLQRMANQGIGSDQELLQVKKELNEMDLLYQDLQKEYSKNPNDERIVNAMIEYYQTKLNIINTIKSDLENVKSIKNKNNENTKL
jgi:archaellum component FlaC